MTCLVNSSWSPFLGVCSNSGLNCSISFLTIPSFGTIGTCYDNFKNASSCNANCLSTHTISGSTVAKCLNGYWQIQPSYICLAKCSAPTLTFSSLNMDLGSCSSSLSVSGTICNLVCSYGYTLSGGSLKTECYNGAWTTPVGTCIPNCITLFSLTLHMTYGTCAINTPRQQSCITGCDVGSAAIGQMTAYCDSTSNWIAPSGFCVLANDCAYLPLNTKENMFITDCVVPSAAGSFCSYSCFSNSTVDGDLKTTCSTGSWSSPTGQCIPTDSITYQSLSSIPTSTFSQALVFFSLLLLVIGLVLFIILKRQQKKESEKKEEKVEIFPIFLVALSLADYFSDMAVLIDTSNRNRDGLLDTFVLVMALFLVIPVFFNGIAVLVNLKRFIAESNDKKLWIRDNMAASSLIMFLSLFNVENLMLINCNVRNIAIFSAPKVSQKFKDKLELSGLLTNMFEDFPQIIIQIVLTTKLQTFSFLFAISIGFSIIALIIAVLRRLLLFFVVADDKKISRHLFMTPMANMQGNM